jgi:phosphoribosylformylglycinamidine cyclo-ligase
MTSDTRAGGGRYAQAGVDIDVGSALVDRIGPLAQATRRPGWVGPIGGFGALFDLKACGYRDPLLVASADGCGTKILLAVEAGAYRAIGIDLVAMSANDIVVQGAQPLFFLDYFATGRLRAEVAGEVVAGVADGCRQAGCALIGGETAEMPGMYGPGEFDLAGFAVGAVERDALLPRRDEVRHGDVILGLASSGAHANGYSLVRPDPARAGPERRRSGTVRAGPDARRRPARADPIYVRACLRRGAAGGVRAMAHVTGGGLVENPPRVLPEGGVARIDASAWQLPPLFTWLAEAGTAGRAGTRPHLQLRHRHGPRGRSGARRRAGRGPPVEGETVHAIGRVDLATTGGNGRARVELANHEAAWPSTVAAASRS